MYNIVRIPKTFMQCQLNLQKRNRISIKRKQGEKDRPTSEVSLVDMSDELTDAYLDSYKGVKLEILFTTRFDKNSDLSTTYLGKTNIMIKDHTITAEERFPMSEQGYTTGKLLGVTKCQILLDTGATKSFMSKSHYLH